MVYVQRAAPKPWPGSSPLDAEEVLAFVEGASAPSGHVPCRYYLDRRHEPASRFHRGREYLHGMERLWNGITWLKISKTCGLCPTLSKATLR